MLGFKILPIFGLLGTLAMGGNWQNDHIPGMSFPRRSISYQVKQAPPSEYLYQQQRERFNG